MTTVSGKRATRGGSLVELRFLLLALGAAMALRFVGALWPLKSDEAGFLIISREWDPGPGSLYGEHWVDRSPLLIATFRVADLVAGSHGPRLVAGALVLAMVAASYRCGLLVGGRAAARWACAAAVALTAQPDLEMWSAKSESLGVPLVLLSCWLTLEAVHRRSGGWSAIGYAAGAGVAAALAIGMKQNLVGGVVFAGVLLVAAARWRQHSPRRCLVLGLAGTVGLTVPVLAVVAWAVGSGVGLIPLWETLFGFRATALEVISGSHGQAPLRRLMVLVVMAVVTGLAFALGLLAGSRPLRHRRPAALAVVAMAGVDLMTLLAGGSYWTAYLAGLVPAAVLAVALLVSAQEETVRRRGRAAGVVTILSAAVMTPAWVAVHAGGLVTPALHYVGEAVGSTAHRADSGVVLYGRAEVLYAAALRTPYRYLWSLPMRARDPELRELRGLMQSAEPPTWVFEVAHPDSWGIDEDGRLRTLLAARYREVGTPCGVRVLLLEGVERPPLPPVDCREPYP